MISRVRLSSSHLSPSDEDGRWEEQANCKGKAFELFEYNERDSPLCEGMTHKARVQFNAANFQLAEEICIECPVMFKCGEEATREERRWTVRGGRAPTRFDEDSVRYAKVGRPVGSKTKHRRQSVEPGDRTCQRGHAVVGGGRCVECKRMNNKLRQREVRKKEREAPG